MFGLSLSIWDELMPNISGWDHIIRSTADLPIPAGGFIDLTSGSWFLANSVNVGANAVRVPAGVTVRLTGGGWTAVLSGADGSRVFAVDAGGLALVDNIAITGGAATAAVHVTGTLHAIRIRAEGIGGNGEFRMFAGSDVSLLDCMVIEPGVNSAVRASAANRIRIIGGSIKGPGATGNGIRIGGDIAKEISVIGTFFESLAVGISIGNFAIRSAAIQGNTIEATMGISCAAASVPALGMLIEGNILDCATPISGFAAADARVNMKCNCGQAGLLTETTIV